MVEKLVFLCKKILNNARLQKDHFGQKMTPANTSYFLLLDAWFLPSSSSVRNKTLSIH